MSSGSRDPELFDGEPDLRDDPRILSNLHDQFCIGRVCHNPAHFGEKVIDALTLESIQSQDQEEQEDAPF